MVNHVKLFAKYIDHVGEMEGVDFIPKSDRQIAGTEFSQEELEFLWMLSGWDPEKGEYKR